MVAKKRAAVLRLPQNLVGRDFVVGDIHGHFELFEQMLAEVDFDHRCDRVLSVGDLIDRGPESARAMEYYSKPWFHAVIGNHESMLIGAMKHIPGVYEMWMNNGGEWSDLISDAELLEMARFYAELPHAIEVKTPQGLVGVVHADMPPNMSWTKFVTDLDAGKLSERDMKILLWSRDTYRKLRMAQEYPGAIQESFVADVHRIFVGHSIVKTPASFGNIMFIDTGAYASGRLCAVDITDDEIILIDNA